MKKEVLVLLMALATVVFTGCATYTTDRDGMASSQLGFTPVTHPELLVKWANDFPSIRAMEKYVMIAPAEVDEPVDDLPRFSLDLPPGAVFVEPAAGEMETYRVIHHTPHQR